MAFGSFVQNAGLGSYASATSISKSLTGVTAGDILVLVVDYGSSGVGTWTISDNAGTSANWVIAQNNTVNGPCLIAYLLNAAGANYTVTASTTGSSSNMVADLLEYSATSSAVYDTSAKNNGTSGNGALSITTAKASELIVVLFKDGANVATNSPITQRANASYSEDGDTIPASSGVQSLTANSPSSGGWGFVGAAFASSGGGSISASISGTSSVSATLTATGTLAGTITGTSSVSATLKAQGALASAIIGTSTISATIIASGALASSISGDSSVSATITASGSLTVTISGTSSVSANLTSSTSLAAIIQGTSSVSAAPIGSGSLSGSIEGTSSVIAIAAQPGLILAAIFGSAIIVGTLVPPSPVVRGYILRVGGIHRQSGDYGSVINGTAYVLVAAPNNPSQTWQTTFAINAPFSRGDSISFIPKSDGTATFVSIP